MRRARRWTTAARIDKRRGSRPVTLDADRRSRRRHGRRRQRARRDRRGRQTCVTGHGAPCSRVHRPMSGVATWRGTIAVRHRVRRSRGVRRHRFAPVPVRKDRSAGDLAVVRRVTIPSRSMSSRLPFDSGHRRTFRRMPRIRRLPRTRHRILLRVHRNDFGRFSPRTRGPGRSCGFCRAWRDVRGFEDPDR